MKNIKLTIEYDGTNYHGWQIQSKKQKTIQGEIKKVLKTILKEDVKLIGSGRTDSGVHAIGQVANFKTNTKILIPKIKKALNAILSKDICIVKAQKVPLYFHAQYSAKKKTYRYTILNREARCVHQNNFCLHYPYKLNINLMKNEAKTLLGEKDFRSFMANDPAQKSTINSKNTVRTITKLSIKKQNDFITITIESDGFLYKMVRNIVGTLIEIGNGKLPKRSIKKILAKKNRKYAGKTAKAKGLTLLKVTY